jgi:glycosyltransferase involved in cell wall biosynthesis
MKILQVIPYFYPAWRFGGPVRVAYDISRKLVERGHSVTVYTSDILDAQTRVETCYKKVEGIHVYYLKNSSLYAAKVKMYVTPSLMSLVKNNIKSFDVVHIHGNRTTQNPIFHYFLNKYSVPYVVQAHGGLPYIGSHRLKWLYDLLFGYRLLRDASRVIALSRIEVQQYLSMGVAESKISMIPNGIDFTEYSDLPPKGSFKTKYNLSENMKIVLYLGRVNKTKGIDLLIRAFALLAKGMKDTDLVLVIVGPDDGYLAEAKSLSKSLDVSNLVLFTGFLSRDDKLKALTDAEVFVTPAFYGFPITFLESCAAGTPIITTSLGDSLEWINNNTGYVTLPTYFKLAQAIRRVLECDGLRAKFSDNCKEIIKSDFSLTTQIDKLENLYQGLIRK